MDKQAAIGQMPDSTRLQAVPAVTEESNIDRDGGMFKAGLIRNVSAITRAEALGHGIWIDSEMLDQTVASGNRNKNGVKSRFTHPGLSSDGLGTLLGRFKNFRREGDKAIGDLHIVQSAHTTPSGDLATHIMDLAEETPDLFATSIVFSRDIGAEKKFDGEHSDEDGEFTSPDNQNTKNLRHARLAELHDVDFVDDPAANPDGLFSQMRSGNDLPAQVFDVLDYGFGKSNDPPSPIMGVHPDRVKNVLQSYLTDRSISLIFEEDQEKECDDDEWAAGESPYLGEDTTTESNTDSALTGAESHLKEGEDSIMEDLKDLTAKQLGKERPELVEEIQASVRAELEGEAKANLKEKLEAETARCVGIVEAGERLGLVDGISERLAKGESVSMATIALQEAKLEQYAAGTVPAKEIASTASAKTHELELKPKAELTGKAKTEARVEELTAEGVDPGDALIQAERESIDAEREDK